MPLPNQPVLHFEVSRLLPVNSSSNFNNQLPEIPCGVGSLPPMLPPDDGVLPGLAGVLAVLLVEVAADLCVGEVLTLLVDALVDAAPEALVGVPLDEAAAAGELLRAAE